MPSLTQLFASTGFVGILLLITAVTGAVMFVRRVLELRQTALAPPSLTQAVGPLLARGQVDRALDAASASSSFLGQTLEGALLLHGAGEDEMLANLDRVAARETLQRGNRISHLVRLAVITLLLGFLGTALGLIAGLSMTRRMKDPTASDFAGSIAEALASSAFGILFAILLFAGFYFLDHRLTRCSLGVIAEAQALLRPVLRSPSKSV